MKIRNKQFYFSEMFHGSSCRNKHVSANQFNFAYKCVHHNITCMGSFRNIYVPANKTVWLLKWRNFNLGVDRWGGTKMLFQNNYWQTQEVGKTHQAISLWVPLFWFWLYAWLCTFTWSCSLWHFRPSKIFHLLPLSLCYVSFFCCLNYHHAHISGILNQNKSLWNLLS